MKLRAQIIHNYDNGQNQWAAYEREEFYLKDVHSIFRDSGNMIIATMDGKEHGVASLLGVRHAIEVVHD